MYLRGTAINFRVLFGRGIFSDNYLSSFSLWRFFDPMSRV